MSVDISLIDALVLCGGRGTRLKSVKSDYPKILFDIKNRPFIEYFLKYLEFQGLKRIILCTGYKHHLIKEWIEFSYQGNMEIIFSQELIPLGTGGAIRNAKKVINGNYIFVINGDTLTNLLYDAFLNDFFEKKCFGSMAVAAVKNSADYGSIVTNSIGEILSFNEKTNGINQGLASIGVYLFRAALLDEIPEDKMRSFEKDIMPTICNNSEKTIYSFLYNGSFFDIGTPTRYRELNEMDRVNLP